MAIALDHRAGEAALAGDLQAFERRADRDECPAEPAGLRIGKGDQARFAQRLVRLIAGQRVPDVVDVALAPPEPGMGMLDPRFELTVGIADIGQPLRRIAGAVEKRAIGGADAAFGKRIEPDAIRKPLRQFDAAIGEATAIGVGEQLAIVAPRRVAIERAHDAKHLCRIVGIAEQAEQRAQRHAPLPFHRPAPVDSLRVRRHNPIASIDNGVNKR